MHVGNLRGHGDDQRVIEKVPIIRVLVAGKSKPAAAFIAGHTIKLAGVVQGENPVHERPGQQDCAEPQRHPVPTGRMAELGQHRHEAGKRRRGGEHQKGDRAVIVDGRALPDRGDRGMRRHAVAQHEIKHNAEIPADDQARRRAPGQRQERQRHRDAACGGNEQPRMQSPQPPEQL